MSGTNINMPFCGTVNGWVSLDRLARDQEAEDSNVQRLQEQFAKDVEAMLCDFGVSTVVAIVSDQIKEAGKALKGANEHRRGDEHLRIAERVRRSMQEGGF